MFARQRSLLAGLIGGELAAAEAIATRLMAAFGSVGGVLSAQPTALTRVLGDSELVARLAAARAVCLESLGEKVQRVRFDVADFSWQQWIIGLFNGLRRERVHIALLDSNRRLLAEDVLVEGCVGGVTGSFRALVGRGLDVDASAVVLMHNHPSGDVRPSQTDIDETRRIAGLLETVELRLEDHLIVAENTIFSMRGADLL